MQRSMIKQLFNFSETEKTIFGDLVFGKCEDLEDDFVFGFDHHISDVKHIYGKDEGMVIVHDFNMRDHIGRDHPGGIAIDYHHVYIDLFDTVMLAVKRGYRKIGWYPEWKRPGVHVSGQIYEGDQILLWYGFYLRENNKWVQKNVYSSNHPKEVFEHLHSMRGVYT